MEPAQVEPVSVSLDGRVAIVTLARPAQRNAVDGPTAALLADAVRAIDADDRVDVGVLVGEGGVFCAGADLKALGTARGNRLDPDGDGPMGPTRMLTTRPWIAAIEGLAVAGGLELALWCDLRVAASDAVLGVFCRRWGVPLIDGGTVRLPRLIGQSRALDLILTGRAVAADEALAMGLVNRVVAPGTAREAAVALARELALFPQACLRADRRACIEQHGLPLPDALALEFRSASPDVLAEAVAGAGDFALGAGRGGAAR
jgi:enoyl-CoA hydratase